MNFGNKPTQLLAAALIFLCIAIWMGTWLRAQFIASIPGNFSYILHAHSHTAMLGWAYLASIGTILFYNPQWIDNQSIWRILLPLFCLSVLGISITFSIQGYGAFSIAFSTMHIILSYILGFKLLRKKAYDSSNQIFKTAIFWQMISTLGIWLLAPSVIFLGKQHPLFKLSIEFFLHFQIQGFFLLMPLGILLGRISVYRQQKSLLFLLNIGIVFTYFLNVYAQFDHILFYGINAIGVLAQLAAAVLIFIIILKQKIAAFHKLILSGYIILFCLQLMTLSSEFAQKITFNRPMVLAYIHYILLGLFSMTFLMEIRNRTRSNSFFFKVGFLIFAIGFVVTECLLVAQGAVIYNNNFSELFWASLLMAGGITTVSLGFYKRLI